MKKILSLAVKAIKLLSSAELIGELREDLTNYENKLLTKLLKKGGKK